MKLNSLQSRITFSIATVIIVSLLIGSSIFILSLKDELTDSLESNARNLLMATRNQVESHYNSIQYYKAAMIRRRKIEMKNNTDIAYSMIVSAYNTYKEKGFLEKEAKQQTLKRIENIRYDNGVGYFWVNDTTVPIPKIIMHPVRPSLIGKSSDGPRFHCLLDESGNRIPGNLFNAFLRIGILQGEGYVDYLWPKPVDSGLTEDQPKIGFVKYFEPWEWIIGTGVYVDDIQRDIKKRTDAIIEDLNRTILKQKIGKNGYFFIFDENNKVLVHPLYAGINGNKLINPSTGKVIFDELKKAVATESKTLQYQWDKPEDKGNFIYGKKAYVTYFEPLGWYIASTIYTEDYQETVTWMMQKMILLFIIFIILSLVLALYISRSISNPLKQLVKSISKTDDDGIPIEKLEVTGFTEIKAVSSTINKMVSSIKTSRGKLIESEMFNKVLFKDSRIPLVVMDPESWEYIDCNQAAADIYQFSSIEETIGKTPLDVSSEVQYNGINSKIAAAEKINDARLHSSTIFEWRHQRPNGELWDAEVKLMFFHHMGKDLCQFSLLDISDRKKVQEQLSHSRKMDAIGQLAGGIAHDFNNMLAGIVNAANILKSPKRNLEPKNLKLVDLILDASTRTGQLISKLLSFSRKNTFSLESLDVHQSIQDALDILTKSIDKKIDIKFNKEAKSSWILGDNAELQNVFLNMGINAAQAMPEGGLLTYSTFNQQLDKHYCESSAFELTPGNYIKIEIRDTGCGIQAKDLDKIFDPFFTTKEQGKGTGLGLSSVYGIIQEHRGAIQVNSEPGSGTVFHIYFPVSGNIQDRSSDKSKNQPVKGSGTILLIDDEEIIRVSGEALLEELGYDVILAENGEEAVSIYKKHKDKISLIISDMIMPKMNGTEAFYKFKEMNPDCKVLIASGFTREENLNDLLNDGLAGFLNKPFTDTELSTKLQNVLNTPENNRR